MIIDEMLNVAPLQALSELRKHPILSSLLQSSDVLYSFRSLFLLCTHGTAHLLVPLLTPPTHSPTRPLGDAPPPSKRRKRKAF